jgi:hypothetical protein
VTDHVIDAIDAALADWETSDDAMRVSYADTLPPVEEREDPPPSTGWRGWDEVGYTTDEPIGTYANADSFRRAAAEQVILYGGVYLERLLPGPGLCVVPVCADEFSIGPFQVFPSDRAREAFQRVGRDAASAVEEAFQRAGRAAAQAIEFVSYRDWMNEANQRQRNECQPAQLSARENALDARRNRSTGPQRDPHRHRGL